MAIDYGTAYHWNLKGAAQGMRAKALFLAGKYIHRETRVLDVGCGDGYMTNELANLSDRVTGVDISASGLSFAAQLSGPAVKYQRADACQLPFKRASFDVVTVFELLEHLNPGQLEKAVPELHRVLKPYGYLVITTPNRQRPFGHKSNKHYQEFSAKELVKLLSAYFNKIELLGLYLYIPLLGLTRPTRELLMMAGHFLPRLSQRLFYVGRKSQVGIYIIQEPVAEVKG